jgi:tripartite-type tricarboxylate transporter receptor subunit TctC
MKCKSARVLVVALSSALAPIAAAQNYPSKPIRLIVPFVAGGGTDLVGRTIGQKLTGTLGQPIVVDNRAGAGGVIGADLVAKAVPDGYTLLLGSPGPLTINPVLSPKMPYDTLRDFAPVSLATISPFMLVVHPAMVVTSVRQLIALAKEKPRALNYGSAGNGSVAHLATEQFKAIAGIEIMHVPYKGSIPALNDLLAGQTQMQFENLPIVLTHIRSGKLRALAVGTQQRSVLVPEFPTMIEAGVPGYEASTAFGVLAPARTAPEIVARLNREIAQILALPDVKERLSNLGLEPVGGAPARYADHMRAELAQNARVVKAAGIKIE